MAIEKNDMRTTTNPNNCHAGISFTCRICIVALGWMSGFIATVAAENFHLKMPVACDVGRSCFIQSYVDVDSSSSAKDYTCGTLTYDNHNGTDFRLTSLEAQRAGVDVIAAADGRIVGVRDGTPDISVRGTDKEAVRGVECGNGVVIAHSEGWETQYCHMAHGSLHVKTGQFVRAGQKLGRVGLSGLTEYPHLHFTVRHQGKIADPFAYNASASSCGDGVSLWEPSLRKQLAYQARTVLNAGFTTSPVTMELIEDGEAGRTPPSADAPAMVVFVRAIGLKTGDAQSLVVKNPTGQVIAENRAQPLQKNMAQVMVFAGRKRPSNGWDRGAYTATYVVERNGQVMLEQGLEFDLQ